VALDARTAESAGYRVGDPVRIIFQHGTGTFRVVGIVGFGKTDSLGGATLAAFELRTAPRRLDKVGQVDEVDIVGDPGSSADELRASVTAALPAGVEALTGQQVADQGSAAVREGLRPFSRILLVFAGVALFVGSFVIWNTFNVLVAQRRREVALLRAVGATRAQVLGGVFFEAVLVGAVSAVLGLTSGVGLAVGIRRLLAAFGTDIPSTSAAVEPHTVVAALLVGLVVTVVAAVTPALSATRVAPIEALRDALPTSQSIGPVRRVSGVLLLAVGLSGLLACSVLGDRALLTALSTFVTFAGLVLSGPPLAAAFARLADRGRRGSGWRLAARNISRAPQRAAATALALTIGLTVVSAVSVTAASARESADNTIRAGNRSDFVLKTAAQSSGVSPAVADRLRDRRHIGTVVEMRYSGARVQGRPVTLAGVQATGLEKVVDLGVGAGSLHGFGPGTMLMGVKEAGDLGLAPGDRVVVTFPETGKVTLRLAATFDRTSLVGAYVISMRDWEKNVTSRLDGLIAVRGAPGARAAELRKEIEQVLVHYPNVEVLDPAELTADAQSAVNQLLGLVTALLLLAVVVAVLGIVNTLVLSVVERTRELGLLRAVGATRRQVRGVVRRESVLMSLLGALTGVVLGAISGVALSRALVDQGINAVSVPVLTLLAYLGTAAVVGVLAAVGPARRASHVDVLRAVTVE
jgi:putative ABC transport system permease protein